MVNKIFTFTKGKYDIAVNYEVVNNSKQTFDGKYFLQKESMSKEKEKKLYKIIFI